jgi:hypothetical protein
MVRELPSGKAGLWGGMATPRGDGDAGFDGPTVVVGSKVPFRVT